VFYYGPGDADSCAGYVGDGEGYQGAGESGYWAEADAGFVTGVIGSN